MHLLMATLSLLSTQVWFPEGVSVFSFSCLTCPLFPGTKNHTQLRLISTLWAEVKTGQENDRYTWNVKAHSETGL